MKSLVFSSVVSNGKKIKIEAKSSKEHVYIALNGMRVYENSIDDDRARGIHVVVLNQHTGVVMAKRIFDTYVPAEDEAMILFLNILQEGRIVVFMVKVCFSVYDLATNHVVLIKITKFLCLGQLP